MTSNKVSKMVQLVVIACFLPLVISTVTVEEKLDSLVKEVDSLKTEVSSLKVQNEELQGQHSANNFVGFSFYQTEEYADYAPGERIRFNGEISNFGGAYDSTNLQFICPVSGYYYFSVFVDCFNEHRHLAGIYKNGELQATANGYSGYERQASIAVVVLCNAGEDVYVTAVDTNSRIYNYNQLKTSVFTGYLVALA